jgi:hypothetical protein
MYTMLRVIGFALGGALLFFACGGDTLSSLDNNAINAILSNVNEADTTFTKKDVKFDSIVTLAGTRTYLGNNQKVKLKLFYFGNYARGYFNIKDLDDKNLQVFGNKLEDKWALKCVTKINMEEAGGYIIIDDSNQGIWSSGHINFNKEIIILTKQNKDYATLTEW